MNRRILYGLALCAACAAFMATVTTSAGEEAAIRRLIAVPAHGKPPSYDPVRAAEMHRRARNLCSLWMARGQRDISAELIPFLQDPDPYLRACAARALGRLEQPAGEAPLAEILPRMHTDEDASRPGGVPQVTLRLALSRIQSRHRRAAARIEALSTSVGLSNAGLARLSERVNNPIDHAWMQSSPGDEVIEETVDLLYTMSRRGEDVRPLAAALLLTETQQLMLDGAALSPEHEASRILDYLSREGPLTPDRHDLAEWFVLLRPEAGDLLAQHVQRMRSEDVRVRYPYVLFLETTAQARGVEALPLIQSFQAHPDPLVNGVASRLRRNLDEESIAAPLP